MKRKKLIGTLFIISGVLILLYKKSGYHSWGGYIDNSAENIVIFLTLLLTGILILKKER